MVLDGGLGLVGVDGEAISIDEKERLDGGQEGTRQVVLSSD